MPERMLVRTKLLDIVGSTVVLLTSVFPVSVRQLLLLGSIFQMGKLKIREVQKRVALS